ncbi:MAG: hypothetical protein WBA16_05865 [Nonlabens sp.]
MTKVIAASLDLDIFEWNSRYGNSILKVSLFTCMMENLERKVVISSFNSCYNFLVCWNYAFAKAESSHPKVLIYNS